jgi:prepilin-type N-terminal cleavage/methylation domain-containing protein
MTRLRPSRAGFSLIEVLLAVFILAIGIISITALFPAGIAQQQAAVDDQLGPVVAEHALGILRNRVRPEDFGTFEEFLVANTKLLEESTKPTRASYAWRPTPGNWSWIRPSLYRVTNPSIPGKFPDGAIDLFASGKLSTGSAGAAGTTLAEFGPLGNIGGVRGLPYSRARYPSAAPAFVVTQRERYWPVVPEDASGDVVVPEYMWDCMFRRTNGRIEVAIFVYRAVGQGGVRKSWVSSAVLPLRRVVGSTSGATDPGAFAKDAVYPKWSAAALADFPGPFTTGTIGSQQGLAVTDFVPAQVPATIHQWQMPGQWMVDNNANVHRVVRGRRAVSTTVDTVEVRLSAPIPMPSDTESAGDYELEFQAGKPFKPGVRTFHYIPLIPDSNVQLVPVYATVRVL